MDRIKKLIYIFLVVLFLIPIYNVVANNQTNSGFQKCNAVSYINIKADDSESDGNQSSGFDFIKSNKISSSIFEHSEILLYGGIFLIAVSVIGIVFTVMPRGNRDEKYNRKRKARH